MSLILEFNNISKSFKGVEAVKNVSFRLNQGSICGLIGENGAGKTTILKMISGLSTVSNGIVSYYENDEKVSDSKFLTKIGTLIEAPGLFGEFSAKENLKMKFIFLGIKTNEKEIEELIELVGLDKNNNRPVKTFSLGMKQRLGIALALVGNPKLLVLDEPINGLDPVGIVEIRNLILKLNKERNITFIISSHILGELEKIVTDYCFIHHGELIKQCTRDELLKECGDEPLEEYYLKLIGGIKA